DRCLVELGVEETPRGAVPVLAHPVILEEAGIEVGREPDAAARGHGVGPEDRRGDAREAGTDAEATVLRGALDVEGAVIARVHTIEDGLDGAKVAIVGSSGRHGDAAQRRNERMEQETGYGAHDPRGVGRDVGEQRGPAAWIGPPALRSVEVDVVAHRRTPHGSAIGMYRSTSPFPVPGSQRSGS